MWSPTTTDSNWPSSSATPVHPIAHVVVIVGIRESIGIASWATATVKVLLLSHHIVTVVIPLVVHPLELMLLRWSMVGVHVAAWHILIGVVVVVVVIVASSSSSPMIISIPRSTAVSIIVP